MIFGDHVLWEGDKNRDTDRGSLAPHVFAYDFKSAVTSSVNVAIKITGGENDGAEYSLHGLLDGHKIFASDFFAVESTGEATVAAKIVDRQTSAVPFSWNVDISWELTQKGSENKVESADKTRLELYWISGDVHEIFLSEKAGIPVEFLRSAIKSLSPKSDRAVLVSNPAQNVWATQQAFWYYNKVYDTNSGESHFGVNGAGGNFDYEYYIQSSEGRLGGLYPTVNCYDQAAMVQVLSSFSAGRASWLYQEPYGFINNTNLIGVGECNNPFFQRNGTDPIIDVNDGRRTAFARHAYNGMLNTPAIQANDRIYDACGGPHLGTETPQQYITAAIDPRSMPSVNTIWPQRGVMRYFNSMKTEATVQPKSSEHVGSLIKACSADASKPHSQTRWDDVPSWVKTVLGDSCDVAYRKIHIGETQVDALWHLTGVKGSGDGNVMVRVRVETRVDGDGKLDTAASSAAISKRLVAEVTNTQLDLGVDYSEISTLWVPAKLDDYGETSIQHAPGILRGRILIVSGNCMIDIRGGTSSEDLVPVARSLLKHTTAEKPFTLHVPHLARHSYHIPKANRGSQEDDRVVKGIGSSFEIKCHVDGIASSASAHVEDLGLLLSKTEIETNAANKTSTVTFTFVTRKVGIHAVHLQFTESASLTVKTELIQVKVVA